MKYILIPIAIVSVLLYSLLHSNHYSPLDSYIDGTIQRSQDSIKHVQEVNHYLDSINTKKSSL